MFELSNKTALITGAGQGIGAGIAKCLAGAGAEVYINDLHKDRAEKTAAEIAGAQALVFDVTDYSAVSSALEDLEIDILVNNAGIPQDMGIVQFKDSQPEQWKSYIDINLYGVLNCTRAAINPMCKKGWGRVITISSGAGTTGLRSGVSAYAAGKGGAVSFMRHLAMETARNGVTANTVALGLMQVVTGPAESGEKSADESAQQDFSEEIAKLARATPVNRLGTPADAGAICLYLASEEASWITGQTLQLNGGSVTT